MPLARIPTPLPPIYTDSDWAFDFEFFGADETLPAAFAADDAASLVFVRRRRNPAVGFELTTAAGTLIFPATHIVGARVDAAFLAGRDPGLYDFELRRLGADGAIEALVVGEVAVVAGLKPQLDGIVPAGGGLAGGTSGAGVKIFTDAGAVRIVRGPGGAAGLTGPQGPATPLPPFLVNEADYIFFDDFSGPLGPLVGRLPTIGTTPWTGLASAGNIVAGNGGMTFTVDTPPTGYATMALGEIPGEIGCTFEYIGVAQAPVLASMLANGLDDMFHFLASTTSLGWTYWKTGSGVNLQPEFQDTETFALTPNTIYTYRVFLDPPYAHGFIEAPDGTIVGADDVYDTNMSSVIGAFAFWQNFNTSLVYRSAWARKKATESISQRSWKAGLFAAPIGFLRKAAGIFKFLHVGAGKPFAKFGVRYGGNAAERPGVRASAGAAEFEIRAEATGNEASLLLVNGQGGIGKVTFGGDFSLKFTGQNGAVFLTKPTASGVPYFAAGLGIGGATGPTLTFGTGSPEGVVTAPQGSIYLRTAGGLGATLYAHEVGSGNTGWKVK